MIFMCNSRYRFCFVCLFFIFSFLFSAKAQMPVDSIVCKSSFLSYKYYVRGELTSADRVLKLMRDSTIAYDKFASANEARVFGYILGASGLVFMVVPATMSLFGNNKAWGMAYAGAGLTLVSIPLFIKHKTQIPKAIKLHNEMPPINFSQKRTELRLGITKNGVGLCLCF